MLNNLVICGRIVSDPEIKETENGRKFCNVTLAVPRSFKNDDGIYETDFIPVVLWRGIAENVKEYCRKGDVVGVRGRLESSITTDDGQTTEENKKINLIVVAERVSFLSSAKPKEEE